MHIRVLREPGNEAKDSLVPRLPRSGMRTLQAIHIRIPERGSLGTRLAGMLPSVLPEESKSGSLPWLARLVLMRGKKHKEGQPAFEFY